MQTGRQTTQTSLIGHALDWWHEVRDSWQRLHELDLLGDREIERMAQDVGLSSDEFIQVASQPAGASALLEKRLAGLHLDPEEIRKLSPLLLSDLQKTCARCGDKKRCAADFKHSDNPEGWESYCPNAGTLHTLT